MAKPKGMDRVGWSTNPAWERGITVLAEKDVNQAKNRKSGQGATYSSGHHVRQLGIVRMDNSGYSARPASKTYAVYTHSQVSNGASYRYRPPAFVGLTHDDLEWLWAEISKELFGGKE